MKPAKITRRCPFCYAPASEIIIVYFRIRNHKKIAAECSSCGARGPSSLAYRTRRAEVVFEWNRVPTIRDWTKTDRHVALKDYLRTHE